MSQMGSFGNGGGGGGGPIEQITTNEGIAYPVAGNVNIIGASNINTVGGGETVEINLNNTVSITGMMTAGTGFIATTGDVNIQDGNLDLPYTTTTVGRINMDAQPWIHAFSGAGLGYNFFAGGYAGNLTLSGVDNVAISAGFSAGSMYQLTSGQQNTAVGASAGNATLDGSYNVYLGSECGLNNVSSTNNVAVGYQAFGGTGGDNVSLGTGTLTGGSGTFNVALGSNSLSRMAGTGSYNIVIGTGSGALSGGYNYQATGSPSSNILIGSPGVAAESNVIRIGGVLGTGTQQQNACYITGIYNQTIGATNHIVSVDSTGKLGLTSGPESFSWNLVTSSTQTLVVNNGYVADYSTLLTFTLPTTAAFGTLISIVGLGSGGWIINQSSGQNIQFGNLSTTHGAGGSLASTNQYDQVDLLCIVANLTWTIRGPLSNLTIV